MVLIFSVIVLFVLSLLLAYRAMKAELSVPLEVKDLKIKRKEHIQGVILFLRKKIIHYSSDPS